METLRVVIAGGGTGGHLFPGVAVAHALVERAPGAVVTFAGTARGLEARVVPREGFELDVIRSAGLKGKSLSSMARGVALLPLSAVDAWRVVSRRRPQVVVGVGGYSSGPVVSVAAARGSRTVVVEPNAVPGLANRLLARMVDAAAVTYDETLRYFGTRGFVSGNPVRAGFWAAEQTTAAAVQARVRRVLVFGGSQGASAMNLAMVDAIGLILGCGVPVAVTHQTGPVDLATVRAAYAAGGVDVRVEAFIDDMDRHMAEADLVVCRAGATTLAELTAAGRAAILVPLPTATDDHQRHNAEALVRLGAAEMIEQRELSGERLAAAVVALLRDDERRLGMAGRARASARPDAVRLIVERVLALAGARAAQGRA
jgi:UDP-N-acetylglucosamine--N-acetylmuramyl-(pentapeptide) pyrophosphoryl-undecaprenol N-acetylglucosamine transferase